MTPPNHKAEREADVDKIKLSTHPRKVVVAGPGTGKSFLFTELIQKKRAEGKHNFLAITFIGKLSDALADDLCGLAKTTTMHSFARELVLNSVSGYTYYPRIYDVIAEDLKAEGVNVFTIGDENYLRKTKQYRAVGDDDVVHYAVTMCTKDETTIPQFDLVLVDEYQDFNEMESAFVDLLAKKNEIVIVGDDDQALYGFKGSSPAFIRKKHHVDNKDWESHSLRFCSRCPIVIIKYFHDLATHFGLSTSSDTDPAKKRVEKEYICYLTGKSDGKDADSKANPKVHLITQCPPGMIAYKVQHELEGLIKTQKIKEVLVIGEGQSCRATLGTIALQLKKNGFKNVHYRADDDIISIKRRAVDAYRALARDQTSLLGWRLLDNPSDAAEKEKHIKNAKTLNTIAIGAPSAVRKVKNADISLLEQTIEDWDDADANNDDSPEAEIALRHLQNEAIRRGTLTRELRHESHHLPRPLGNLDITVCNILNAKGLGADVVFVVGFDQGKFPSKKTATESEIYQMLVAITRAKKRLYLINTVQTTLSQFGDVLAADDVHIEEVQLD